MTKNDLFFKILFAIQIAMLPITIAVDLISSTPTWAVCLCIAGVLLAKIWVTVFKNKNNTVHNIIDSIGTVATFTVLLFFFANKQVIPMWLAIVAEILVVLFIALKLFLRKKTMPEIIDAVDYCFTMFEFLTLLAFTFAFYNITMTNIGLFAICLSTAVSVAYKVYYCIKYRVFRF